MTTPQIQKIREVCSSVIEARENAGEETCLHIAKEGKLDLIILDKPANCKFFTLAGARSAPIARSLIIAVEALERFRGEEKFYSRIEANDPVFHFPADEALEQITSQLMGEE